MRKMLNKKGFTLAELLIVVAIIAVLVAIAIPIFTTQLEKAREQTDAANLRSAYAVAAAKVLETEVGVSAGITFPIANRNIWHNRPLINMSVQWVHTNIPYLNASTMRQSALTENYFKFCLGITFSERWFYKWKVQ